MQWPPAPAVAYLMLAFAVLAAVSCWARNIEAAPRYALVCHPGGEHAVAALDQPQKNV